VLLASISAVQVLELVGVGFLAGVLGGLLGIGGGIVMIPAMVILLGQPYGENSFHLFKLGAITTSILLSALAALRHRQAGAIVAPMAASMVPLSAVGVGVGVLLAGTLAGPYTAILRRLFGVFLELVVVISVYQDWLAARGRAQLCRSCPMPRRWLWIGSLVGLPAGVIGGLLGVGGGIWAVPVQKLVLGIHLRHAIANSSVMVVAIAIVTSVLLSLQVPHLQADPPLQPAEGWWLAVWLTPGAVMGGWLGAGLTHTLPVKALRRAFLLLLVIAGLRLILG
jgi:uncharacterized membrane protein YfcA